MMDLNLPGDAHAWFWGDSDMSAVVEPFRHTRLLMDEATVDGLVHANMLEAFMVCRPIIVTHTQHPRDILANIKAWTVVRLTQRTMSEGVTLVFGD